MLSAAVSAAAPASPSAPPLCESVVVSPAYRTDRTLVCVHRGPDHARILAVSRDRGRTWHVPAMSGLVRPPGLSGVKISVALSPRFGADRALYATTGSGTFVSTDFAETFGPVDALTKPSDRANPVAFVGRPAPLPTGAVSEPTVLLAHAGGRMSGIIDPRERTRRIAIGVPGVGAMLFVVPPVADAPAGSLTIVNEEAAVGDGPSHAQVYRCDAALTCAERLFTFPDGHLFSVTAQLLRHPDGSFVAVLSGDDEPHGSTRVWRSTDGGATFTPWRAVERLLAPSEAGVAPPYVAFASDAAAPRRVYLRVETAVGMHGWWKSAPPASQIFRSDDAGATWRRVGYSFALGQPGKRPTFPWRAGGWMLQVTPDGRLLADGGNDAVDTTWCSVDGGRRWYAGCPR